MAVASSCHDVVDRYSRRHAHIATAPACGRCSTCDAAADGCRFLARRLHLPAHDLEGLVEIRRPDGRGVPNAEPLVEACDGVGVADAGTAVEQGRLGLHELADYLQSLKPEGVV